MSTLFDYLTIKQASELLGVSPSRLRYWDRTGKVEAWSHPVNGYRLYPRCELQALLIELAPPERLEGSDAR
jgi:MerR family copper efflux transcriptional regulator